MAETICVKTDNYNLFLNKKQAFVVTKDGYETKSLSKQDNSKKEIGRKQELTGFEFKSEVFATLNQRLKNHARAVCSGVSNELILAPDYRLVVGIGNPSVYETSLTLHHIHGFPYIPASGIKGALRNYVINTYFELDNNDRNGHKKQDLGRAKELNALQNEIFCRIFGCPAGTTLLNSGKLASAKMGEIVFFDSYPTVPPKLEMDIMTPHYNDYYNGNKPPADWQNPTPIPFLTVGPKTDFQFIIGLRKNCINDKVTLGNKQNIPLLSLVFELLLDALTNHGIGAKTAVGYGYLKRQT